MSRLLSEKAALSRHTDKMDKQYRQDTAWLVWWSLRDRPSILSWDQLVHIPEEALHLARFANRTDRVHVYYANGQYIVARWSGKNRPRYYRHKEFYNVRRYLRSLRRNYEPQEARRAP